MTPQQFAAAYPQAAAQLGMMPLGLGGGSAPIAPAAAAAAAPSIAGAGGGFNPYSLGGGGLFGGGPTGGGGPGWAYMTPQQFTAAYPQAAAQLHSGSGAPGMSLASPPATMAPANVLGVLGGVAANAGGRGNQGLVQMGGRGF
jgi:hypothetical protein